MNANEQSEPDRRAARYRARLGQIRYALSLSDLMRAVAQLLEF